MGQILAQDTWQGDLTRIYVAYPSREEAETWEADPELEASLERLRAQGHELTVGWGYPHYNTTDYVITIARGQCP